MCLFLPGQFVDTGHKLTVTRPQANNCGKTKGYSDINVDLEGNQISFVNTGTEIVLLVTDIDGGITEIRIPVGSFGICSTDECAF